MAAKRKRKLFAIVLFIIVCLAAVLWQYEEAYRHKAYTQRCLNNMKSIGCRLNMYCQDHDNHFPNGSGDAWALFVPKYHLGCVDILFCPEDHEGIAGLRQARKEYHGESPEGLLPYMKKNGYRLSSYTMPEDAARKGTGEFDNASEDVILREIKPHPDGSIDVLYADWHCKNIKPTKERLSLIKRVIKYIEKLGS